MKSKVLIIYTGGTIGMVEDLKTGSLHPFDFDHLFKEVPELEKLEIGVDVHSIKKPIDSSNMDPAIWFELIQIIEDNYHNYNGFVILHGSDTMAYTASALSFLIENNHKPIIFTGSQLPIGTLRTDGKENLITAIEIAGATLGGEAIVPEVAIYFEYALYRGNRTTKMSAENFEAFQSPNYPLLAEAGVHIKYNQFAIAQKPMEEVFFRRNICGDVASIKMFPGMKEEVFKAISGIYGLKGLILETFGSGNAPSYDWLIDHVKKLVDQGVLVVNITQCMTGSVIQGKYETGAQLERIGVIGCENMTFEAAITKLMYLLACEEVTTAEAREYISADLRGEIG